MKTVIEMAREADKPEETCWLAYEIDFLERFAELARADEREAYKWDIHSCGPTCQRYACVSMREAVAAEREACAKLCEGIVALNEYAYADECATVIRAKENT